jgi:predicted chitinase
LNALADNNDIEAITTRINGGLGGISQRTAWVKKATDLLEKRQ